MINEPFFPILIVEDNPVSRNLLEKILIKAGYKVESAENGRQALEILEKKFIPCVITDWMMPEMDGLELCRAIRSRDFEGYIFVVFITARDSRDDIIAGLDAGADEYLTKPVNQGELRARLNTAKRVLKLEESLKKANEEIKQMAITDPLTGVYNRCYLTERMDQEIKRAFRYGHPLSLIMCDIDYFKKVNDSYGHQAGDLVLKGFVECLKESIRDGVDWVARYGGEEFLIALPETDLEGACVVGERLRSQTSESVVETGEKQIKITASFGVTSFDSSKDSDENIYESMISEADRCLYLAKNEGRNRVVSKLKKGI